MDSQPAFLPRPAGSKKIIQRMHGTLCLGVFFIGTSVLTGWAYDVPGLKSVFPGLTTMKANTALGLIALAIGLIPVPALSRLQKSPVVSQISLGCGLFVIALALATLSEYFLGLRLGIDELLFADPATTSAPYNGRMAPATAIAFALIGGSVSLLAQGRGWVVSVAHGLVLLPAAIGSLSLIGYAYGTEGLYNFGPYVSVALNTAVGLCALSVVALFTRADEGWRRQFVGRPASRAVLTRLLPWSLIVPFGIGLLVLQGARLGIYAALYTPALFAVATTLAFVALSWTAADAARRVETDLVSSEARFRQLAETLPAMVFVTNAGGRNTYVNATFLRFTGLPTEALLDDRWHSALHADDVEATQSWQRAVLRGQPYEAECRVRRFDGAFLWHLARGLPLQDENGAVTGWFGTFTDIQDIIDAREALGRANEELEAQVSQRTAELVQLQKMDAVGQLTGGIAHDFNNLLTPIMGTLDLLRPRLPEKDGNARQLVDTALQAASSAATLVHRLLAFARRQDLQPGIIDIGNLVTGLEDLIRRSIGTAAEMRIEIEPKLNPARVDPNQLELAILNLAINARDAMPNGGRLTIRAQNCPSTDTWSAKLPPGAYVRVSVSDTGIGMDETTLARCIEPFFSTKGVEKGAGLGLSMAHGLAAQSDGALVLQSVPGKGTTAELWLPAAAEQPAAKKIAAFSKPSPAKPSGAAILLVDDEAIVRTGVALMLRDLGYRVVEAGSAAKALEILRDTSTTLHLLITDFLMPGANGAELAAETAQLRPGLPILLITGYSQISDENAKKLPRLSKPFRQHELTEQVSRLLTTRAIEDIAV